MQKPEVAKLDCFEGNLVAITVVVDDVVPIVPRAFEQDRGPSCAIMASTVPLERTLRATHEARK